MAPSHALAGVAVIYIFFPKVLLLGRHRFPRPSRSHPAAPILCPSNHPILQLRVTLRLSLLCCPPWLRSRALHALQVLNVCYQRCLRRDPSSRFCSTHNYGRFTSRCVLRRAIRVVSDVVEILEPQMLHSQACSFCSSSFYLVLPQKRQDRWCWPSRFLAVLCFHPARGGYVAGVGSVFTCRMVDVDQSEDF